MRTIALVTKEDLFEYLKPVERIAEIHMYSTYEKMNKELDRYPFSMIYLDVDLLRAEHVDIEEAVSRLSLTNRIVLGARDSNSIPPLNTCHQYSTHKTPFNDINISHLLDDIISLYRNNDLLLIKSGKDEVYLRRCVISSVSSANHYYVFETSEGFREHFRCRFSEIEPLLRDERFIRCDRGIIVNMRHVESCEKDTITMSNGSAIPVKKDLHKSIRTSIEQFKLNAQRPDTDMYRTLHPCIMRRTSG